MRALTPVDVVLGEATSGTREQRYRDMLAIASAIENRSLAAGGLSHQDIISAPGQFNAYNRSLPPGSSKYRELARKAFEEVLASGPVHNGTFYATPRAVGNLPKGLEMVTSTAGHQFFVDPQQRPFLTAAGYVKPVDVAPKPSLMETITAPIQNVASTVTDALASAGSALRTAAFEPVSRPKVDVGPKGLEALAPNGLQSDTSMYGENVAPEQMDALRSNLADVRYNMGPNRPNKPSQTVVDIARAAVKDVLGPGYSVDVISGQEPAGSQYGSNRHKTGLAADIRVVGPNGNVLDTVTNRQEMLDVAQAMAAKGAKGIGIGTNYMTANGIHVDQVTPGPGQDYEWGNIGNANAALLADARSNSLMPDSYYEQALPAEMDAVQPRNPDPLVAAPLGQIERAPLAPVPSSLMAAPAGVVERGNLAAAQPREPDPERFGPRGTVTTATADRLPERTDPLASLLSDGVMGRGRVTPPSFNSAMMTAPASGLPSQTLKAAPGTSLASNLPGIGPTNATYEDAPELTRRNPIANLASKAYDLVSGAVTPSAQASPSIPRAALGIGQTKAPSFTSARMTAPATSLPAQRMVAPAAQPSPAKQASVYQQAAASRAVPVPTNSMNSIPRGTMLQPPAPTAPANAALMSPSLMGPAQSLVPQGPQPLFTPAPAMPAVKPQVVTQPKIAQPVTTPTTSRVKTPQQRINDAFGTAAPPAPKFTASDIYGGQVGTGTATGGNSVSRFENNPNTYVTNAFGVTTATGPNGNQMAVNGKPGPLSKASLSDPLAGMLGKMPSGKTIAGSLLGAALGNMVGGPLAGAVGAKLGSKLASGNIAQNSLLSKLMGGYSTNILGQRMTFANPTSGGPFPNAPDRPSGSDRSYDVSRGRDISPGASREIEAGRGGLY